MKLSRKIPVSHLVAVFNALPPGFSLRLPLVGVTAYTVDLRGREARVGLDTRQRQYEAEVQRRTSHLGGRMQLDREFPSFRDLQGALVVAGVAGLSDRTEAELRDTFRQLETRDPGSSQLDAEAHYYLGFDTNCFYHCLLSTHIFPRLESTRGPRRWDLAISEHTISEIRIGSSKLGEEQTGKLKGVVGRWVGSVLRNQPRLADRRKRLAMVQFRRALNDYNATRVGPAVSKTEFDAELAAAADRHTGDGDAQRDAQSAVSDGFIALSYSKFACEDGNRCVLFLTFDRECAATCAGYAGLKAVTLSLPDLNRLEFPLSCRWEAVGDLVKVLARLYGRVELLNAGGQTLCTVDGYWFGSGREPIEQADHEAERLWVEADPGGPLGAQGITSLGRSLRVLEALGQSEEWRRGNTR